MNLHIRYKHAFISASRLACATPLFTQPDVTTATYPGHYLGRKKLNRRPCQLWNWPYSHMRVRETMQASRNSTEHEMCDAGQRYESGDARGGDSRKTAQPAVANNTGSDNGTFH